MAYSFYCTHCGRQLDQTRVLLDMYPIITGDPDSRLELLKFRLTMAEFMELYNGGTADRDGFHRCRLPLEQLLGFMANENNLDNADIAKLTVREMKEYLGDTEQPTAQSPTATPGKSKEAMIFDLLGDDAGDDDPFFSGTDSAPQGEEPIKPAEFTVPAAIQALLDTGNKAVDDILFTKIRVRKELEMLYNLFRERDVLTFKLHLYEEEDNDGKKILTAYRIRMTGKEYKVEARVCPHCDTPVFEHAGTAEHQSVAFIGYQASGKTSTILALTHYAENAILGSLGGEIWGEDPGIDSVLEVTVIGKSRRLVEDLTRYPEGIAPPKTEASKRTDAYSATLRIKSKLGGGKWHLLTLVDLPGELCKLPDPETGELKTRVDENKVLNEFQIALSADAYVVCFDTSTIAGNEGVMQSIKNVCTWADDFQNLRANKNSHMGGQSGDSSLSIPMMVLFTKCADLEGDEPVTAPKTKVWVQPLEQVYMFCDEKQIIRDNRVYNRVMEQFGTVGRLNLAYHAVLRSSPFGYKAPSKTDLKKDPSLHHERPSPRNIGKLMRWLLCVSGCIPTEAEYRKHAENLTPFTTAEGYCVHPPQSRIRNPIGDDEALARCALFENPGCHDKERVNNLGESAIVRLKYKFWRPNSNAEGN